MLTEKSYAPVIRSLFEQGIPFEEYSVRQLVSVLQTADGMYFNEDGDRESCLTDTQYDAIKRYVQRVDPTNEYLIGVGSSVRGGKIKLPFKMGSLDQVYEGELVPWITNRALTGHQLVVSDKLDGTSAMLVYSPSGSLQIAFSRGDGVEGADITRHVSKIHNVPRTVNTSGVSLTVRAEVIMTESNFQKLRSRVMSRSGQPYKNARNMVAGLMNASDNDPIVYEYLDVVVYQVIDRPEYAKMEQLVYLKQLGFSVVRYSVVSADTITEQALVNMLQTARSTSKYALDGVVVEVDDAAKRAEINPTRDTLNPAYAMKYKVADESNRATPLVTGVSWAVSKDGYYKPTIQIEPTDLVGVTIQNCTGFNAKFIKDNGIGPGARIVLVRSGDVIPFCQSVVSPSPTGPQLPDDDTATWTKTGVDLVVSNVETNATAKFEQLLDFFTTIGVDHLGEGNLRVIFDAGFTTPESVIELTQQDLQSLLGSSAIAKKIFAAMRDALTGVHEYQIMGAHPAFGRGVGVRKMKKLWEHYKGDLTPLQFSDMIRVVDGFDTKTADKVSAGLPKYLEFKQQVSKYIEFKPYEAPIQGKLTGMTVVFTGFRSKELEAAVEQAGGKMGSGVSSKTSLLVADDPHSASGKAAKARELGVKIIGIEQLREMIK